MKSTIFFKNTTLEFILAFLFSASIYTGDPIFVHKYILAKCNYENMPIQIYQKFKHQKMENFA